jgi:hypothetical protein
MSVLGVPAFWRLQRGTYRFGWTIYEYGPSGGAINLVQNGGFAAGLSHWDRWAAAATETNRAAVVKECVRIAATTQMQAGVKQHLMSAVSSGQVLRLSAVARCVGPADPRSILGGRVAFVLPPQPEQDIKWFTQRDMWMKESLVFTNRVTGMGIVLVHLGYGSIASTAEFSDVRLERVEEQISERTERR